MLGRTKLLRELAPEDVERVAIPAEFTAGVTPQLQPGTVLLQTDLRVLPEIIGKALQVLNADVPTL